MNDEQRIKAIKARIEKGDQSKDKAEQHYASAGILLNELRDGRSKAEWAELLKTKCDLSVTRAYELIAIADRRKTVADLRLAKAESVRKVRFCPLRSGQNKAATSPVGTCSYCGKKREVLLWADGDPAKYACDECRKLVKDVIPDSAGAENLPAKPEPERKSEPTLPANPLVEAWDKAGPKQRHDFVLARKFEIIFSAPENEEGHQITYH
jgi:hypothetical protein